MIQMHGLKSEKTTLKKKIKGEDHIILSLQFK